MSSQYIQLKKKDTLSFSAVLHSVGIMYVWQGQGGAGDRQGAGRTLETCLPESLPWDGDAVSPREHPELCGFGFNSYPGDLDQPGEFISLCSSLKHALPCKVLFCALSRPCGSIPDLYNGKRIWAWTVPKLCSVP